MAYDKEELFKKALKLIKEEQLIFAEDVIAKLGIAKPTFYDHFKNDSNELNSIKEAMNQNRVDLKVKMRKKWFESDNPTLQMGLMKLVSTETELRKLSMKHVATEEAEKPIFNGLDIDNEDEDQDQVQEK